MKELIPWSRNEFGSQKKIDSLSQRKSFILLVDDVRAKFFGKLIDNFFGVFHDYFDIVELTELAEEAQNLFIKLAFFEDNDVCFSQFL